MIKSFYKILFLLISVSVLCPSSFAVEKGFQANYRPFVSLNGEWKIIVDPYENGYYNYRLDAFDQMNNPGNGAYFLDKKATTPSDLIEYNFEASKSIQVPGDWNTQCSQLYYYEGTVWYQKKFNFETARPAATKSILHFGAVNYKAEVYLNGQKLGVHSGGFTPFYFDITGIVKERDNSLVVKVDNKRLKEGVPTLNTDWWNYGGITREVKIITVPNSFIANYKIKLESTKTNIISGYVVLEGNTGNQKISLNIPELGIKKEILADSNGTAQYSFTAKKVSYWSPENPKLYRIEFSAENDKLVDSVGFRTINTKDKQILLNDRPIFFKGISVHEEYSVDGGGRVKNAEEAKQLLLWAKELGCNFVRLAHYPHNEDITKIADRLGLMVWSEVPVYWTIDWENEATFENARSQLTSNILRDQNRACIVVWSLANETPVIPARNKFLFRLAEQAKSMDNTRLLSAAMEKHYMPDNPYVAVVEDPLAEIVDLVSFNEYVGWYDGLPEKCQNITWSIPYNKPVFISEFGAGAKYGLHGTKDQRWTEEFQEDLYKNTLRMLDKIDGLSGMSPWILVDFRSPRRVLPGIQDDYNRKGLLSEKGEKKKAFFVLQKYYQEKTY